MHAPKEKYSPLEISEEQVIRFGMIEGTAVVDADYAVYDAQNVWAPEQFHNNGSKARHLAIVTNRYEASILSGLSEGSPKEMAAKIADIANAEIVIIKMGAIGALVYEEGAALMVPAFKTDNVWKVGSGDIFVAHLAYNWMQGGLSAVEAAHLASKATAYYAAHRGFATVNRLATFSPEELRPSARFVGGHKPLVYLAGPFFTLAALWLIEQARKNLLDMGLRVFSPYHEVGHGSAYDVVDLDLDGLRKCDVVLAIGDGLDSGTVYEVGYARAMGKPVIFYSENESESDKKMMAGSGCILCHDYATAIYKALWAAAET
jgi:nucleoside 2-deoxyribosyltransferase